MSSHNKLRFRLFSAVALLASASALTALPIEIGRGTVEVRGSVRGEYDSNIFLNSTEEEDFLTSATAKVQYVRDVGIISSQLALEATGGVFADHSDENFLDPAISGLATFQPSDKTTATGGFSLRRSSMAKEDINERSESNDLGLYGSLENLFSEKLGYRLTGAYNKSNSLTAGYADVLSYSAGINAVYLYSPKLKVVGGYTHRESWNSDRPALYSDRSSKDDRFSGGLEGQLAAKITGQIQAGIVSRSFNKGASKDSDAFYLSAGLKWVPAQKTSVAVDASQDFGLTAAAQSSKVTSLTVGATQVLDDRWSVDGAIGIAQSEYSASGIIPSREDDTYRIKARATYSWTSNVLVEFAIGYADVDSTRNISTYDRVNAGVGVTASF